MRIHAVVNNDPNQNIQKNSTQTIFFYIKKKILIFKSFFEKTVVKFAYFTMNV